MKPLIILLVMVCVATAFLLYHRKEQKKREQLTKKWEEDQLSDENVLTLQIAFEERLHTNADLPDGIGWKKHTCIDT